MKAPFMTLQGASVELGKDARLIRGVAIGLGITLTPIASGLCMSREDYERVKKTIAADSAKPDPSRPVVV